MLDNGGTFMDRTLEFNIIDPGLRDVVADNVQPRVTTVVQTLCEAVDPILSNRDYTLCLNFARIKTIVIFYVLIKPH